MGLAGLMIASMMPINVLSRTMAAVMNSGFGALRALTKACASARPYGHGGEESQRITSQFAKSAKSGSASLSRGGRSHSRRVRTSICVSSAVMLAGRPERRRETRRSFGKVTVGSARRFAERQLPLDDVVARRKVGILMHRNDMRVYMRNVRSGEQETDLRDAINLLHHNGEPLTESKDRCGDIGRSIL